MDFRKFFNGSLLKKIAGIVVFAGFITFFCVKFYSTNITSFPYTIHAWAQGDRFALALNFQKNGFDLFHPRTFNLRPQFPAKDPIKVETGITQVDCPIHEYIIAIIMTAIGNNSPVIFRLYNLLYGILGLFFLFLMVRNNTKSQLKSVAVVLFAFLSPVLIFYLDGFLPSVSSLASELIGYYFYFEHRKNKSFRNLVAAVLFAFLAALSRTPFALFLGAMFCQVLFDMLKKRNVVIKNLLPFFVAFGILLGFFFYNRMLAKAYGSVFLMNIMPVTKSSELYRILKHIYESWLISYFTIYHYLIFLFLSIVFIVQWIRKKKLTDFQKNVGFQLIITLVGAMAYFCLMVAQYHSHDYYFIDSFYIPCILFVIMCIDSLGLKKLYLKIIFAVFVVLFGYLSFGKCRGDLKFRYTEDMNSAVRAEVVNFKGSGKYLDSLKISTDAKILVMKAYSANIPFIMMNRTGYGLMNNSEDDIKESLTWDFDYIAMQNEYILSDVLNSYPDIINELEPIGTNDKISIYKKLHREKSLVEFLQIKGPALFCTSSCPDQIDPNVEMLSKKISCDSVLRIKPENEFTDMIKLDISNYNSEGLVLIFNADCRLNVFNQDNTDLVVAIDSGRKNVYYKSFSLNQFRGNKVTTDYLKMSFCYPLQYKNNGDITLSMYIWNNGRNDIELKNIGVWILGNAN